MNYILQIMEKICFFLNELTNNIIIINNYITYNNYNYNHNNNYNNNRKI